MLLSTAAFLLCLHSCSTLRAQRSVARREIGRCLVILRLTLIGPWRRKSYKLDWIVRRMVVNKGRPQYQGAESVDKISLTSGTAWRSYQYFLAGRESGITGYV